MLKRKHIVFVALALASCLLGSLFYNTITQAQVEPKPYDPWVDINDDGVLDIMDVLEIGIRFGEEGTPINKVIFKSGNVSVPAAAFVPQDEEDVYSNLGYVLYNYHTLLCYFYASIQLPHGATVTNLTVYWYDKGTDYVMCTLYRHNQTIVDVMAYTNSPQTEAPEYGSSYDDTILHATVDNNQYAYYLKLRIPPSTSHTDYSFQYALIEYTYIQ